MFDNIYLLYILSKYKLGLLSKKELIIGFREYIINRGQVFIKLIQLFLMNQYKWGDYFTNEEYEELNKILDNVHDDIPESDFNVGCGSVAYVYFNKLDNTKVIKKLIPNIEKKINDSFINFKSMINLAKTFNYDFLDMEELESYKTHILIQTNLIKEAESMKRMKENFKMNPNINIPQVFFFSKEMIEMEFVEGVKLEDFLKKNPERLTECNKLLEKCLKVMINNKFIHGDLHPGNLLFYLKKDKVKLNIIDCGLVIELDEKQKRIFKHFIFTNNFKSKIRFFYEISSKKHKMLYSCFYKKFNTEENKAIIMGTKKLRGFDIINLLKKNNISINIIYLNLLITICSLRLKLKKN